MHVYTFVYLFTCLLICQLVSSLTLPISANETIVTEVVTVEKTDEQKRALEEREKMLADQQHARVCTFSDFVFLLQET